MRFDLNLAFICTCSKPKLVSSKFVVKKLVILSFNTLLNCYNFILKITIIIL